MSKERLIDANAAAKIMGCHVHNVWAMIRRQSLKAVKQQGKLYTCELWIEQYQENKRSKDLHSIWNGRRVFDPEKGELSVAMVAKELGYAKVSMYYYINSGKLKTIRKGHYLVIMRDELERFKLELNGEEELANNA